MKASPAIPKWLKVTIDILSAWASFMVTIAIQVAIIFVFQSIFDLEIEGTPAVLLLIIVLIISGYIAYRVTKWQTRYFAKKSLRINLIYLLILLLLCFATLPISLSYVDF